MKNVTGSDGMIVKLVVEYERLVPIDIGYRLKIMKRSMEDLITS